MANTVYTDPTDYFYWNTALGAASIKDATSGAAASLGDANSTLVLPASQAEFYTFDYDLIDVNGDGELVADVDYWIDPSWKFIGYTLTVDGVEYPFFLKGVYEVFLVVPESADATFLADLVDGSGMITSNVYQSPEDNSFLCFAPNTGIATPDGDVAVEALSIGDTVMTKDGDAVAVKWIGRQTVSTLFGPAERLLPVRVSAGALGDGLPVRDLVLTADHALLVDGLLVNAGALVNGTSITRVPLSELGDSFTVYHVETEAHDLILAEGAPAETYIDYVARRVFDNYDEYVALYGEDRTIPEMAYPRISSARMLPVALRQRLGLDAAA